MTENHVAETRLLALQPETVDDGRFNFRSNGYAWWVVAALSIANVVAALDRQIINLLVEPIKRDLSLSDTHISLLQGFAFAIFYAILAIPLGRLADSRNRGKIIIAGMMVWSIATFCSGIARGYATLFVSRVLNGAGEATLTPAGFSLLGDYFPRSKLGRAIGVFLGSGFLGSGLALVVGGYIISKAEEHGPISMPVLGLLAPWQISFIVVALPGFLCAALMLAVREPPRQDFRRVEKSSTGATFRDLILYLTENLRSLGTLFVGFSLLAAVQFSLGAWVPSFFVRTYGWTAAEIGSVYGLYFIVLGTLGVTAGGWVCDALFRRGYRDANLRTALVASLPALPLLVAFPLAGSATASLILLGPLAFLGSMPFGAGTAAIPMIVPNRFRAQIVAIYLLCANLLGQGVGPTLVAVITDYGFGDPQLVRYSLAIATFLMAGTAIIVIFAGLSSFRRQVEASLR